VTAVIVAVLGGKILKALKILKTSQAIQVRGLTRMDDNSFCNSRLISKKIHVKILADK
jgi:hypothetical protein